MISPENLSVAHLKQAFVDGGATDTRIDENDCLHIGMHGKKFLVTMIDPHQVRFLIPSSVALPLSRSQSGVLKIANELNSDLAFVTSAYVSDEDTLIYTHPLTISGGVSEWNVVMGLNEFAIEQAIFEQIVEKRFAND